MQTIEIDTTQDLYTKIAPHILGNNLMKKFLALQMFVNPNEGEKLHILVVGGSSTGKSEICNFIREVMIGRSAYLQKDATPIGLREVLMQSPQLLFIDEFDKSKKDTRGMLLEAMQSQTVTIDKFGEHGTAKARINVTALCNPLRAELSKGTPLISQLSFAREYYLLSRFHFVIAVYPADAALYGDIAVAQEDKRYNGEQVINKVRDLVYKIKLEIPRVTVSADLSRKIGNYVKYLKEMNPNDYRISPRLIEGFFAAVKARARMSQRKEAKDEDLDYIKKLYDELF